MTKKRLIVAAVLALAGIGAYVKLQAITDYVHKMQTAKADAVVADGAAGAPAVTVVKVGTSDFVEIAAVSGSLAAREEIMVSPEIEGFRVLELMADEGTRVTKGQILARLAAEPLDAQLAQSDAAIARAAAAIARAKSTIVEAQARESEAEQQLERAKPLKKSGYLSGAIFDQRESAAKTTAAQTLSARDGVTSAEADKAELEARRREIIWRKERTEVKAPADGTVSRRNARIGAMATAGGEPMFRIIEKGDIELVAEIVETELAKVKAGQKASIHVPGAGEVEGTVRLVSPEIDKSTRLGRIKIALGANSDLKIGAFARGSIVTAESRGVAIPASAAGFEPEGTSVQVVKGDRVEKRILKTGLISGEMIEVKSGLNDGDVIVARAGTFLRDGDAIRPVFPAQQVSAASSGAKP